MNYASCVAIILTLTACDTVPTHPNHPVHLAIIEQHKNDKDFEWPKIESKSDFFSEKEYPDEKTLAYRIADEVMYTVDRNQGKGVQKASRDAHPKENGCVKAEFHTHHGLDSSLAKGVFADGQVYEALIRFSNSSENPAGNDHDPDARGMAIKLTQQLKDNIGQTENKPLEKEQDFILINHPVFILDDPSDYLSLLQAQNTTNVFVKVIKASFALGLRGMWNAYHTINQDKKVKNPLQTQYFSMVPYALGKRSDLQRRAIKFSVKPYLLESHHFLEAASSCVAIKSSEPKEKDENYLRTALHETLDNLEKAEDVCMEFLIQEGPKGISVEDSQIEWENKGTLKFKSVALIKIPKQDLGNWKESVCENESFDPWHAWEEHLPVGVVNRLRKVIYPIVSEYRRCLNFPDSKGCKGIRDDHQ